MNINWYPGHMVKAKKEIEASLKLIDVVIEILDARICFSSQNPDIPELTHNKPRVIALNKFDLADVKMTNKWIEHFKKQGITAVGINSISGKGIPELLSSVKNIMKDKLQERAEKGHIGRQIRTIIVGIPNSGKSSFINRIAKKAIALAANKPGVTKRNQWIKTDTGIEFLDTPGILWPKFEIPQVGLHLAFTGAIRTEILDTITLAADLTLALCKNYSDSLKARYKLTSLDEADGLENLRQIGIKRGCIISKGEIDMERAALLIIDEFRSGKMGLISLEDPDIALEI